MQIVQITYVWLTMRHTATPISSTANSAMPRNSRYKLIHTSRCPTLHSSEQTRMQTHIVYSHPTCFQEHSMRLPGKRRYFYTQFKVTTPIPWLLCPEVVQRVDCVRRAAGDYCPAAGSESPLCALVLHAVQQSVGSPASTQSVRATLITAYNLHHKSHQQKASIKGVESFPQESSGGSK